MREICKDCKAAADAHIASFVGLRHILKNLLEHGHVGLDYFHRGPFYFLLSRDLFRSGFSVEGHLGLDAAALDVAHRHFNYKSGDRCVVPLVQLSGYFLSSLELIDPLGELRHPLFGN
jgi:hypothetical protein